MKDLLLVTGDMVKFEPTFGSATITLLAPVKIIGSSQASIGGKQVCVLGDETKVTANCTYINPPFATPGKGTLKIIMLMPDQMLPNVTVGNKPALVKGKKFIAMFTRTEPAKMPNGTTDPIPMLPGFGGFEASQDKVKGGV